MGWFETGWLQSPGWFMPYSLQDLIHSALRVLGRLGQGETPSNEELQDGVQALNIMLSSWSAQGLATYAVVREDFNMAVGQPYYTIGADGNYDTDRPLKILSAYVRDSGGNDTGIEIIGRDRYNSLGLKTTPGTPNKLWYQPEYPLGLIFLYPTPDSTDIIHLDSMKELVSLTELSQGINLPAPYTAALKWNLALELAPEYEQEPSQVIVMRAEQSFYTIKRLNLANSHEPICLDAFGEKGTSGDSIYTF